MPRVTAAHNQARRRQILLAMCICMARKGFHKTSMREVCRTAGLSPGAVYSYFKSKEEILHALAEDGLRQSDVLLRELEAAGGLRAAFRRFVEILFDCVDQAAACAPEGLDHNRIKVALWAEAIRNPEILERFDGQYRDVLQRLAKMVRRDQRLGRVRRGVNPGSVAQVMVSLFEGFTLQRAMHPELDAARYREAVLAVFEGALWAGVPDEQRS
jgi:AcrR family transcriptional regulator